MRRTIRGTFLIAFLIAPGCRWMDTTAKPVVLPPRALRSYALRATAPAS